MFQRRHYRRIANVMLDVEFELESPYELVTLRLVVEKLGDMFEEDNEFFSREKFEQAVFGKEGDK